MNREQLDPAMIGASAARAYMLLSERRGYAVKPGDCACVFIAGMMADDLFSQGLKTDLARHELVDGSSNWMVRIDASVLVDAAWFSMLEPPLREGQPSIIVIDEDRGEIKGISGEELSDAAVAYYLMQYTKHLFSRE